MKLENIDSINITDLSVNGLFRKCFMTLSDEYKLDLSKDYPSLVNKFWT